MWENKHNNQSDTEKNTTINQMSGKRNATINQMSGMDTEHELRGEPAPQQYQLNKTGHLISTKRSQMMQISISTIILINQTCYLNYVPVNVFQFNLLLVSFKAT